MNKNLTALAKYCSVNRLTINSRKTKYLIFYKPRGRNLNAEIELKINGSKIEGVSQYDYPGIRLDNTLSYKSHINKQISSKF